MCTTTVPQLIRKILFFAAPIIAIAQVLQAPYATPTFASLSSGAWPSDSEWASLNRSIGGRLQALSPWAAVCYTSDLLYDAEECQLVLSGYDNDTQACFQYIVCCIPSCEIDSSAKQFPRRFCGQTGSLVATAKAAL
ncbi:hypothetical protein JVT61DRAFT_6050 [Boletus reticuloceps]|uniref:Uncharacterized protein n=1 Tax=Boletus reticuloceps TaxID=495285 RepID=A0A8I2YMH9_9AGAM|nr:hypothetical protein JVT61DRAFT_6050 [Boletus reticuloceps]